MTTAQSDVTAQPRAVTSDATPVTTDPEVCSHFQSIRSIPKEAHPLLMQAYRLAEHAWAAMEAWMRTDPATSERHARGAVALEAQRNLGHLLLSSGLVERPALGVHPYPLLLIGDGGAFVISVDEPSRDASDGWAVAWHVARVVDLRTEARTAVRMR